MFAQTYQKSQNPKQIVKLGPRPPRLSPGSAAWAEPFLQKLSIKSRLTSCTMACKLGRKSPVVTSGAPLLVTRDNRKGGGLVFG